VRPIRVALAMAASIVPLGCAAPLPSTKNSIEAGAARLETETVALEDGATGKLTARVNVAGAHKQVWVLASDCTDGVGYLATAEDLMFVFANGDKPADRIFAEICAIRRRAGSAR